MISQQYICQKYHLNKKDLISIVKMKKFLEYYIIIEIIISFMI